MIRLHQQNVNTPEYYNEMWSHPENHDFDRVRMEAFCSVVEEGNAVLDLGAGLYGFGEYLVRRGTPAVEVWALDFSPEAKRIVQARCPGLHYNIGNVLAAPFKAMSFDVVAAGELIEHMENPALLAAEMARLCRPGGWLVISTVDPDCEDARKLEYPEHLWKFTPEELLAFFAPFGQARYQLVGDYHFVYCRRA